MARSAWGTYVWLALAAVGAGCATTTPKTIASRPAPPVAAPTPKRLTWLPFEPGAGQQLARVGNERLARVVVEGATRPVQAPVSMEMAQLALECIERTPKCWSAVGRSLGAELLLWAELERTPRGSGVTLRVALFEVDARTLRKNATRAFPNATDAGAGFVSLVDDTFGVAAAPTEPPP